MQIISKTTRSQSKHLPPTSSIAHLINPREKFRLRYSLGLLILTVGNRNFRRATNTSKLMRKDQASAFRAFVITPLNQHYGSGPSTLGQYRVAWIVRLTCDAAVGIASGRVASRRESLGRWPARPLRASLQLRRLRSRVKIQQSNRCVRSGVWPSRSHFGRDLSRVAQRLGVSALPHGGVSFPTWRLGGRRLWNTHKFRRERGGRIGPGGAQS